MTGELIERAVAAGRSREAALPRAQRRAQGVVHTPAEIARFALDAVDAQLRAQLACPAGLSDARVALLDPALGPGVWIAAALERVTGPGITLFGYDVDADALDGARTLLSESARQVGATLTLRHENTLAVADPWGPVADRMRVIVGNPPWAARSGSRGVALSDLWLSEFRSDAHGVSLGERRTGVLSDDYVRFFRWALEQARTSPAGAVVCLATNSSFLDGPVHRGMRAALVNAFDQIDVLDLGGNALAGGDGVRDDNVFGVRVGTCLTLAVRRADEGPRQARVSYRRLHGSRADKLAQLAAHALEPQVRIEAVPPFFRFVAARAVAVRQPFGFSLAEAFPFHREGVQTNRDAFVTDHDPAALLTRLQALAAGELALPRAPHLSSPAALRALQQALDERPAAHLPSLDYRPLEARCFLPRSPFCHRPRPELARAVVHSSVCLLSARKDRGRGPWRMFGVSRGMVDACYLSTRSSSRTRVFPSHAPDGSDNLEPRLRDRLTRLVGHEVSAAELLAYCLGVLAADTFRHDHDAELHADYARMPWPRDAHAFERLRTAGAAWTRAWLDPVDAGALPAGACELALPVASVSYDGARAELRCGDHVVEGVPPSSWAFRVGDFPVLQQLTRARPTLTLSLLGSSAVRVARCVEAGSLAESAYHALQLVR